MQKRGKNFVSYVALSQIFSVVCMTVAVAFILGQSMGSVSAEGAEVGHDPSALSLPGRTSVAGSSMVEKQVTLSNGEKVMASVSGDSKTAIYKSASGKEVTTALNAETGNYDIKSSGGSSGSGIEGTISSIFGGSAVGGGVAGSLIAGVAWAGVAFGAGKLIGGLFGMSGEQSSQLGTALAAGGAVYGILQSQAVQNAALSPNAGGFFTSGVGNWMASNPFMTGLIVAALVFVLTYKSEKQKLVNFQCLPYEPQLGGKMCEECNKDPFRPCSEYRCKSLGQACELLNKGSSEERCAWVGRDDVNSPIITPKVDVLNAGLSYIPDKAVRPDARGVKIVKSNGDCLQAFTKLQFGIDTNEPAQCKIDYNHTASYDSMKYYFGGSNYYEYNHTQLMALPSPNSESTDLTPMLRNDGYFSLYVRCRDANNNSNVDEYSISFCVDKSPDTTPPLIEGFSVPSGSPISYNTLEAPIEVYVNEPAECRWSRDDKAYADMENNMSCATKTVEINARLSYTCSGKLTSLESNKDNTFYFRCKDQPGKAESERFTNSKSTPLVLRGTQPLVITSVKPNSTTITGNTDPVGVNLELQTNAGAGVSGEEGRAICYFSPSGLRDSYVQMFDSDNYLHNQTLYLGNGNYTYYLKCVDAGGNSAEAKTAFRVFVDRQAPSITRVYKEGVDSLKVVTDEDAQCVYSTTSCNYIMKDGVALLYSNPDVKTNSYAQWKPSVNYYIKCRDMWGNEPNPNECSIITNAIQFKEEEMNNL